MRLEELPNSSGVYAIVNTVNGKVYVGSSQTVRARCDGHMRGLNGGSHPNSYLQRVWHKYGETNFVFILLKECALGEQAQWEQLWMNELKSCDHSFGYNIAPMAHSNAGFVHTEETIAKMRVAQKLAQSVPETRAKMRATKKAISRERHEEEWRKCKWTPRNKSRSHCPQGDKMIALWRDPEYKAKVAASVSATKLLMMQDPEYKESVNAKIRATKAAKQLIKRLEGKSEAEAAVFLAEQLAPEQVAALIAALEKGGST